MKLTILNHKIRDLKSKEEAPFADAKLVMVYTVDTDSFAIEMIADARKTVGESGVKNLLCLRENSRKRKGTEEIIPDLSQCVISACFGNLFPIFWWETQTR